MYDLQMFLSDHPAKVCEKVWLLLSIIMHYYTLGVHYYSFLTK